MYQGGHEAGFQHKRANPCVTISCDILLTEHKTDNSLSAKPYIPERKLQTRQTELWLKLKPTDLPFAAKRGAFHREGLTEERHVCGAVAIDCSSLHLAPPPIATD